MISFAVSCVSFARKEKEKKPEKSLTDSGSTVGDSEKEEANLKSEGERQIEEAEIEIAQLEAAWQEKKIDAEYKLEFLKKDNEVIKGKVDRCVIGWR